MSKDDERIVKLGFDNAKFEAGASKSMSTLDKLNEKLKFKEAQKGTQDLQRSVDNVDFSSMARAIDNIERRFSTMGIAGMNVINQITNGIIGSVKRLEQATIGQIKSGGWARAMNIANAKFQIEGLGFAWDQIEGAVSYGVKDTAYGLDAAASAASQLAASGVDFQKSLETVNGTDLTAMHKSLRAISGVAAMTNSSYEDIARIFTTVAGNGRLMGDQLLQLSSRGMNAAAKLAEAMHTTESDIRDMVSRGKIDFQTFAFAMDDAFGAHAKEANKTFTGALGNMKAALSRVGEIFADPVINKTNTLFIALTGRIDEFKNKLKSVKVPRTLEEIKKQYDGISLSAAAYDAILKANSEKTVTFGKHFAEMWQSGIDAFSAMIRSIDIGWFDKIVEKVDSVTVKVKDFFDLIKDAYTEEVEETAEAVNDATKSLKVSAEEAQAAKDIIQKGMYGAGIARQKALKELFGGGEEGAQHAKNVQAYIDSVVSANYDYEKATIKVADANEELANTQRDLDRENKKAKLKSILDTIRTSMSNLWKAAKNVITSAKKIASAIGTAFSAVFKMDFGKTSKGIIGFTELIVELSRKLIVGNDTTKRITDVFTVFFSVVKRGIDILSRVTGLTIEFVRSLLRSKTLDSVGDNIGKLLDKFVSLADGIDLDNNPILTFLSSVVDAIGDFITGKGSIPSKLTTFVNSIIDSITSIKWGEFAKFGAAAFAVYSIAKFIYAVKALGGIVAGLANLPGNIGSFFFKLGYAVQYAGDAYVIVSVAKSLAIVAGALVVLSQVNDQDLYKAIGTLIIISVVIKSLLKTASTISAANKTGIVGIASEVSYVLSMVKVVSSVALMVVAMAGAVAIIGVASAIIKRSGADDPSIFLTIVGILSAMVLVTFSMTKILGQIDVGAAVKFPVTMAALSLFLTSAAISILGIAGAMALLDNVDSKLAGLGIISAIFVGIVAVMRSVADVNPTSLLAASVTVSAVGAATSTMFVGIATAMMIVSNAVDQIASIKGNVQEALLTVFGILSAMFLFVLALIMLIQKNPTYTTAGKQIVGSILSASVMFVAMGAAIHLIANALETVAGLSTENLGSVMTTMAVIFGGMIMIMHVVSEINAAQILAASLVFVSIAAAVLVISGAIAVLSNLGSDKMWLAATSVFTALVGIGVSLALVGGALSESKASAALVVGGILSISVAISAIALALSRIGNLKNVLESAMALSLVIVAIGVVVTLLSSLAGETGAKSNSMLAISAAFVMVAGSLLILAVAMEKIGAMDSQGLIAAGIAFGVIAGALLLLSVVGAFVPKFAETITAVGTAFLTAGLGAALVGAGIYLVCAALKVLAPAVGVMAISMDKFFTVLENHPMTAVIVGGVLIATIVAITVAIMKLAPVLKSIAEVVSNAAKRIGGTITSGVSRLKGWFDTFTIRGKAAIASLIVMLCGAIMKASPQVLDTVGKLIIKLLAYLGSIAGDVAKGLLEFVINLINGLADAIRGNSARIAAAIWGVVMSLIDVVMQILGQLLYMIIAPVSNTAANAVNEWISSASDGLNQYAIEQRKLAEEADKNKQDYIEAITKTTKATEEASEKSSSAFSGLTGVMKSEFGDQKSELASLKEEYSGLPGYAYDAILRSKQSQASAAGVLGSSAGSSLMNSFSGEFQNGSSIPEMPEYLNLESSWSPENAAELGGDIGAGFDDGMLNELSDPDGYYDAQSDNMDNGTVKAIEDSKEDVKKAIKDNVNDPAQVVIRSSRQSYYDSASYCIQGLTQAIDDDEYYEQAMRRIARRGEDAFRAVLDINSPSKKYYENGAYIVAGLANGIDANIDVATSSMGNLSQAIIDAFGDPITYCAKIASGELSYVPRIRPVVDASAVYGTAGSISSMFDNQAISINGVSGRLAADIGTLDQSNVAVVNELRELRADMAAMTEQITNMQMVMDTGVLVGQISGPIDRELGRRAVFRGRGN